jgi:very-short-patch-repair endonuclease
MGAELRSRGAGLGESAETRAVAALARRQHGVLALAQLVGAGLGRRAVARLVAKGWLTPLHRGVYQVGPVAGRWGREMAAVLAYGPSALLSHHSAAAVWGISAPNPGSVDVIVPATARRSRPGIRVHRTNRTHSLNAAVKDGLPLTNPARTLLDLAPLLPQHDLDRATEQAQVLGLASHHDIEALLDQGARGTKALRAALHDEPSLTRSEAERRFRQLIRAARLPRPETNARVAGYEVDFLWRSHRLVVEVDGFTYHGSRAAFERDRTRDADLMAAGYRVVRFTWRQITCEPHAVVAQLAALLQAIG